MKFNLTRGSFVHRPGRADHRRLERDWRDVLGILVLSLGILSLGSFAIASGSYQLLKATEPKVERVTSPLAWDF